MASTAGTPDADRGAGAGAGSSSSPLTTSSRASEEGVAFKRGDDFMSRWSNIFNILAGRMSDQGQEEFRRTRDLRNEAKDCRRCEDDRDYLLKYSPVIRFMRDNINQLGGDINDVNVRCRRCDRSQRQSGGFDPEFGILVCANELRNRGHLEDTLAHEMVHAYDHLRYKVDWRDNLRHAACAEIRASNLSGECRFMREFVTRGQWSVTQQQQEFVKRRAVLSVMARPACRDRAHATEVVSSVWDSCFTDTRPFDEVYR